ncbi:hypothetical protein [Polymorphospora rubra]|uniref:Uncharacterized protein n=1 Tax=Polymorphospora rubra TaxID=338584 RepID=A0A810MYQ1_9ACTN|nr:hypothetical protein [Polymorphospora rubra]BCJ65089.1 hypothetical protein Prubr_21100 [Polymorphospora rubra]
MSSRARALTARGNIALALAVVAAVFGGMAALGAGGWTNLHVWIVAAVLLFASIGGICLYAAGRRSPQVTHPPVSHPTVTPSLTPHEVRK